MILELKACSNMCETCPFRKGSQYDYLVGYLSTQGLTEGRICHSTGDSAFYGETGNEPLSCRGVRDLQLQVFYYSGFLDAPTDEAWTDKVNEINNQQ